MWSVFVGKMLPVRLKHHATKTYDIGGLTPSILNLGASCDMI